MKPFKKSLFATVVGYPQTPRLVSPPTCSNVKAVTKKVEINLSKNEVYLPNHTHLTWQFYYTFSGGILTQAVFGEDTGHGGKILNRKLEAQNRCKRMPAWVVLHINK